jgi:hypothetical protein
MSARSSVFALSTLVGHPKRHTIGCNYRHTLTCRGTIYWDPPLYRTIMYECEFCQVCHPLQGFQRGLQYPAVMLVCRCRPPRCRRRCWVPSAARRGSRTLNAPKEQSSSAAQCAGRHLPLSPPDDLTHPIGSQETSWEVLMLAVTVRGYVEETCI